MKLAIKLASDVSSLAELRMRLRELMFRSPLCDGVNFTRGLESTYRNMWHRYCHGDVPSTKYMKSLQDQSPLSDKILVRFSEHVIDNGQEHNQLVQTKVNGTFDLSSMPTPVASGNC